MDFQHDDADQRLCAVFRYKFPGSQCIRKRITQSIIKAILNQRCIAAVFLNLLFDDFFLRLRQISKIHFITKYTGHGHNTTGLQRCDPSRLFIRNHRNVGANRPRRITERSSVLNSHPVQGIRIVTAPDLRCVIKHSRIEPAAAAAASFDEQIRIPGHQSFKEII